MRSSIERNGREIYAGSRGRHPMKSGHRHYSRRSRLGRYEDWHEGHRALADSLCFLMGGAVVVLLCVIHNVIG